MATQTPSRTRARILALVAAGTLLFYGWPFAFGLPWSSVPNGARGGAALTFHAAGIVLDPTGGRLLQDRLAGGTALTVAAVVSVHGTGQTGPARLVSLSEDPWDRNFTLGQERDAPAFRVRTPATGANGIVPGLRPAGGLRDGARQIVVATYDGTRVRLFVDGRPVADAPLAGGPLAGWDPDYPLVFGNEATGTRPWLGRLEEVAVYDTALSPGQVAALTPDTLASESAHRVYSLAERCLSRPGTRRDDDTAVQGACEIPPRLRLRHHTELLSLKIRRPSDYLHALVVWVPAGLALAAALPSWPARSVVALLAAWATLLEAAQLFLPARSSSLLDLLAALLAGLAGVLLARRLRPPPRR